MSFGDQLRSRREELNMSRATLAEALGVSKSAIGNYETGISFPKEDILLRLFDCLQIDPNYLYQDSFRNGGGIITHNEQVLLEKYRGLSSKAREVVRSVMDVMDAFREDGGQGKPPEQEPRVIPLYHSPPAVGYAAPVFGEDFDYLTVTDDIPRGAEFAVRISGNSMSPWIADEAVVYVNRDPLSAGDVGIFCVDGHMLCRQYYRAPEGTVHLLSLNRNRSGDDVTLPADSGKTAVCFGRVMIHTMSLPENL